MEFGIGSDRDKGVLCLAAMRVVLGFMLLWAFFDKLLGLGFPSPPEAAMVNGGSPTAYYLSSLVSGPFEGMFHALAGNAAVDILLMAGLLLVGAAFVLGIASRLATVGMCVMMAFMFILVLPPADNPVVDYHIVYILASLAIYLLGGFDAYGLGGWWKELGIVKRLGRVLG